ncbi:hypothetical protein OFN50_39795, partial [Escherichia coli]|nr:hypothetical protein [Escherichia coli]
TIAQDTVIGKAAAVVQWGGYIYRTTFSINDPSGQFDISNAGVLYPKKALAVGPVTVSVTMTNQFGTTTRQITLNVVSA